MASQELLDLIAKLSREEQNAVEEFIRYLREKPQAEGNFRAALDSFVREHSELLRRLAK
jgi:signal transduction histidine kinase